MQQLSFKLDHLNKQLICDSFNQSSLLGRTYPIHIISVLIVFFKRIAIIREKDRKIGLWLKQNISQQIHQWRFLFSVREGEREREREKEREKGNKIFFKVTTSISFRNRKTNFQKCHLFWNFLHDWDSSFWADLETTPMLCGE